MERIQAVRIIKFDAGHRLVNHESKCANLHGHEYKAEIFAEAIDLDSIGRVVDFSVIKEKVGKWIDENWDHTMIINEKDPFLPILNQIQTNKKIFISEFNPTAENMASYLLLKSNHLLKDFHVRVKKIKLWETSNCFVVVEAN